MGARLRWLPTTTLAGPWQMAIDDWLLAQAVPGERRDPLLRFYHWSQPTLSLGKHQRTVEDRWIHLVRQGRLALARRPSGGSAVLHGGDLTYALLWPDPPRQRREAYRLCCRWLQDAFAALGQPLAFGDAPCRADQAHCFASSTAADLVHADGQKRIGSAQVWRGHSLLQHGSVLLAPDPALWEAVFGEPAPRLPGLPLAGAALEDHLLGAALRWLPATLVEEVLTEEAWGATAAAQGRYEVDVPASVVSATAWATGSRANPRG
ncbi:MAG: lipoate--protein ligase family protein [Cyanobacteriota bacterium]|jgi:lipoate-protein ligase A